MIAPESIFIFCCFFLFFCYSLYYFFQLQKKIKEQDVKIQEQDTKLQEQNVKLQEQEEGLIAHDQSITRLSTHASRVNGDVEDAALPFAAIEGSLMVGDVALRSYKFSCASKSHKESLAGVERLMLMDEGFTKKMEIKK